MNDQLSSEKVHQRNREDGLGVSLLKLSKQGKQRCRQWWMQNLCFRSSKSSLIFSSWSPCSSSSSCWSLLSSCCSSWGWWWKDGVVGCGCGWMGGGWWMMLSRRWSWRLYTPFAFFGREVLRGGWEGCFPFFHNSLCTWGCPPPFPTFCLLGLLPLQVDLFPAC